MVLKSVRLGLMVTAALAWGGACLAADYKPDEFLGLDLSTAVLSPKRLGPSTQFAPVPVEARSDVAHVVPDVAPKAVAAQRVTVARHRTAPHRIAHAKVVHPKGAARVRLAHRHGNPLDAQAMDTRIQTWPCRSGGICDWKR